MAPECFYRFYDVLEGPKVVIRQEVFSPIKETPKGYWVVPAWMTNYPGELCEKNKRWVSKTARRRYCYPSLVEAWKSYRLRKKSQAAHIGIQQERVAALCRLIETYQQPPEDQQSPSEVLPSLYRYSQSFDY